MGNRSRDDSLDRCKERWVILIDVKRDRFENGCFKKDCWFREMRCETVCWDRCKEIGVLNRYKKGLPTLMDGKRDGWIWKV